MYHVLSDIGLLFLNRGWFGWVGGNFRGDWTSYLLLSSSYLPLPSLLEATEFLSDPSVPVVSVMMSMFRFLFLCVLLSSPLLSYPLLSSPLLSSHHLSMPRHASPCLSMPLHASPCLSMPSQAKPLPSFPFPSRPFPSLPFPLNCFPLRSSPCFLVLSSRFSKQRP